ncbi:hypothetical protein F5Y16DRAFT_423351 [Xylariaceae sp. FL0255]|nr:hypothetical protein F5Y16DRAFT_423351 [Xylariaceae sp. FL0255]
MNSQFPSIQSFYSREVQSTTVDRCTGSPSYHANTGDGFTASEIEAATNPLSRPFKPSREYIVCAIAELETGIHNYEIRGRVVNFSSPGSNQATTATAAGNYFLIIADESGAFAVKLYCSPSECQPILGQRVTVWATTISAGNKAEIGHIPFCLAATTIYPGRNGATHITLHTDSVGSDGGRLFRTPLEANIRRNDYFPGLMTLKAFLVSGYDTGEGKILVCVRSIGPRRTIQSKRFEKQLELVEVGVYDDTASCIFKLWEDKIASARPWAPNQTILLLSNPSCCPNKFKSQNDDSSSELGIDYSTMIHVDPNLPEADWLRTKVRDMTKKQSLITPFPADAFDIDRAMFGPDRTLFTIAEVDEQVRNHSATNFTGKLNVIVHETNFMEHFRKSKTCCTECCGIPLYANKPTATCKHCGTQQFLSLNPRLIGSFLDESGELKGSKLVWSDQAWTQMFYPLISDETGVVGDREYVWEDITGLDTNSIRDLEEEIQYSRLTLTFGWSGDLDRLCILGVEW